MAMAKLDVYSSWLRMVSLFVGTLQHSLLKPSDGVSLATFFDRLRQNQSWEDLEVLMCSRAPG